VVSDVFVDKDVPEKILSPGHVKQLLHVTATGGMGVMNIITEKREQRDHLDSILQVLKKTGVPL